jgi:hypothetical protein
MTGTPGSPSAGTHGCLSRATAALIDTAIRAAVAEHAPDITGISCLQTERTRSLPVPPPTPAASSKRSSPAPSTVTGALRARDRADPAARPRFGHQRGLPEAAQRGRALPAVSARRSFLPDTRCHPDADRAERQAALAATFPAALFIAVTGAAIPLYARKQAVLRTAGYRPDPVIYMFARRAIRAADPADSHVQARTAPKNRRQKRLRPPGSPPRETTTRAPPVGSSRTPACSGTQTHSEPRTPAVYP